MTQGNVNLKLGLDTSPATAALQQYYKKLNQSTAQAAASQKTVTTALEKVIASAKKLGLTYDTVTKSFKDSKGAVQTITQVKQRVDQLNTSLAKTKQSADTALAGIGAGFKQVLQGIPQGIGLAIGQQLLAPLNNFGSALNGAIGGAVERFVDIDAALRQTASISGATTAEFEELQDAVINLAKDTKFTTGELAEASIALARAGFTAQEVQQALPGIAEGAAAAGQSMDQMADTVIGAMGGFQKGTDETIDVVDVLTQTANMSNQSVTDLGEALKYVGPIANGLGLTMEDTSAAIGLLANAGIRGSQAGTTLRSGLSRLAAAAAGNNSEFADLSRGTGRLAETLQRLGADVTDTNGDLLAFPELLKTLKASLGDLGANEQQLVSKILFGEEAAAGFRALLANTVEDIDGFAEATNNATGVAKDTSEKNLAGIGGSLVLLSSAFDAASATVGKFLGTILKPLVDGVTALLNAFNSLPGPVQAVVIGFTGLTIAVTAAGVAFAIFTAAANAGVFATIANSVAGAVASFGVLAAAVKTKAVAAFATAKASSLAFSAMMTKQISVTAALTAAKAKLTAAQLALNAATGVGAATTATATGSAVTYATAQTTVATAGTASAAGSTAAAGGAKAFIAAAAPIAAVAVAVLAVAAAWNTYNNIFKGAKEVNAIAVTGLSELRDTLKEVGGAIDEVESKQAKFDQGWAGAVERVGVFDASLDILRKGLGLTTAEEAQLNQETIALYRSFEESDKLTTGLTQRYEEIAQAMADGTSANSRADDMESLKQIEEAVLGTTKEQIKALEAHKQKHIETSGGIEKMTDAEKEVLKALDAQLKSLGLTGDLLEAVKEKYLGAADAAGKFGAAVESINLDEAKKAFNDNIKAMEGAFKDFQDGFKDGLKKEVSGIKDDLASLKKEGKVFTDNAKEEISSIKEVGKAAQTAFKTRIDNVKETGSAEVEAMEMAAAAADETASLQIANLEEVAEKEQDNFRTRIDNTNKATEAAIAGIEAEQAAADQQLESEISALEAEASAASANFDAQIKAAQDAADAKISAIEAAGDAANEAYEAEVSAISNLIERDNERYDQRITSAEKAAEAAIGELRREQEASDRRLTEEVRQLDDLREANNAFYDNKIASADAAHQRVMANYDRELDALDQQRDAVNDAFDARLEGLRNLSPAEAQLAAIRKAELEAEAAAGGIDGLRAQATLERMALDEEAAKIRKEQTAVLAALEEQREAKQQVMRAAELAHEATISGLKETRLQKELDVAEKIEKLQREEEEKSVARAEKIRQIEEDTAAFIEALENEKAANEKVRLAEIEAIKKEQATSAKAREKEIEAVKTATEGKLKILANQREANEKRIVAAIDLKKKEAAEKEKIRQDAAQKLKTDNIAEIERLEDNAKIAFDKRQGEIEKAKDDALVAAKKREDEILAKKKEIDNDVKVIEAAALVRKGVDAGKVKELEEGIKRKKAEVAAAEEKALSDIKTLRETEDIRRNEAEDAFDLKRSTLLSDYQTALGEANTDIVNDGNTTWTTYANNAIIQINRVAAAVARAASGAASGTSSAGPAQVWTGGPVSAGQIYTVNELGQEAFMSSSGKLSMIDAPAWGNWKAPSKGTVINAAQTEKLGLMASAGSPVSAGAEIDPTGGQATQKVSGSESRNLLRAIAKATGGDNITNHVTIQSANTTQAASDMMVELTKIKRRRLR